MSTSALNERLIGHLKTLHLPAIRMSFEEEAVRATQESLSYEQYLFELADQEVEVRRTNRIARFLRESRLPLEKGLDTFDLKRLPRKLVAQVRFLLEGSLADYSSRKLLNRLVRMDLLLVDEMSYLNLRPEQTNIFFKLMEERYGKKATIITTNLDYDQWFDFLGNKGAVEALLDRLRHQCHTVRINGPSLRTPSE
jgi:DNA replication protein DnaC